MVHFATNVPDFAGGLTGPGHGWHVSDRGHSIHNERPFFLASQLMESALPTNFLGATMAPLLVYNREESYVVTVAAANGGAAVQGAIVSLLNELTGTVKTTNSAGHAAFPSTALAMATVVLGGGRPAYHPVTIRPRLRVSAVGFAPTMFVPWREVVKAQRRSRK